MTSLSRLREGEHTTYTCRCGRIEGILVGTMSGIACVVRVTLHAATLTS